MSIEITPELLTALRNVRAFARGERRDVSHEINVLDNAGIFAVIDEATGYDVDPEPERVSKCTCPPENVKFGGHLYHCPGDPAEWGDLAYTTATAEQNMQLTEEHNNTLAERRAKARQARKETTARWQRAVGLQP